MNTDCLTSQDPECARLARRWSLYRFGWIPWLVAGALTSAPALGQPNNDDFGSAAEISGSAGFVTGANGGATAEAGEPDHAGASGGASVWWRWTAPASGTVAFSTIGSHFDTVMAVYEGDAVGSLLLHDENDDELPAEPDTIILGSIFGYQSRVAFEAVAGTTYRIAVDGLAAIAGNGAAMGEVVLVWNLGQTNDDFADAMEITLPKGIAVASTANATWEIGEPDHFGISTGASLWWRWAAPSSGPITFNLVRSEEADYNTLVAVYVGSDIDQLSLLVGNDNPEMFTIDSGVTFEAMEGTTYWIAVDGAFGETPDAVLRWTRERENDDFADAFELSGAAGTTTGDNIFATPEPWSEPDHGGLPGSASVWWNWTATASGPVTFDTFGSTFDTILAVYVGDEVWEEGIPFPLLDLTPIVSNDDDGDGAQSLVNFVAVAGTTYRIAVVNYDPADRGDIVLNWHPDAPLPDPLRIEDLSRFPDGTFRFVVRGSPGTAGMILRSRSLDSWEPWKPFSLDGGAMEVTDPDARTAPNFFYKAAVP